MELNKALLDCMQSLRRRLRDELQLDIRLSQPDAVEAMLLACLRSTDQDTRNLAIRLAELSDFHSAPAASQGTPGKQYRGHSQAPAADTPAPAAASPVEEPRESLRMYRGQRIHA
ncbi:hypothetical protein A9179_16080 [Pseudomonas alcaligenes]|uniref:Uncharacterized protein n=1 Tax=Aquipseudomonas alcaligenes TaxID=43263 RepID=A0ABR7S4A5_AQUAC|nr:hypothetical protein [Pseudomonas alcaligenes]MBC9251789.1 hypothetical protein [Pseudomonas alcaligenes]